MIKVFGCIRINSNEEMQKGFYCCFIRTYQTDSRPLMFSHSAFLDP